MMNDKYLLLRSILARSQKLAVAFSAGVDSTFLLKAAHDERGENVTAFIAVSPVVPSRDLSEAEAFCEAEGIRLIKVDYDPLSVPGFCENPVNRCYICKKALFTKLTKVASEHGIDTVIEGSNADDVFDYRPGMKALEELGIGSPLKEAGLTKDEIRQLSKVLGLATHSKSSFACLATRIPYGDTITAGLLERIELAEDYLYDLGISQFRVRTHGDIARIEVLPSDIERLAREDVRLKLTDYFKSIGYKFVALDLTGYRKPDKV